jgi:gamma-glutamylaminecyclotransferase
MKTAIFVYGTLQRGQRNHKALRGQQFLGAAQTLPRYRLYNCGQYPGLVDDPQSGISIQGEVWEVSDDVLCKIDDYEGVPTLYSRRPVLLQNRDPTVEAYFYNGDISGLRDCGDCWPPQRSFS